MTSLTTQGLDLASWQQDAVEAWIRGDARGPHRGTLEIVTGGGKTLIALECAAMVAEKEPDLRLAIVVPTEALARQWQAALLRYTNLIQDEVGLLGAGGKSAPSSHRAVVAVLKTAARRLPALAHDAQPMMLIVDECHRAGAPMLSRVLDTPAKYRLGLSATPDRQEFNEGGELLAYDEQLVGEALGAVVYRFSLRDARETGWLPDYVIHHHGVSLTPEERANYEAASRRVDDYADRLRLSGGDTSRAQQLQRQHNELGRLAKSYIAATAHRKDMLYRAEQRHRVAFEIVQDAADRGARRVLLFHERIREAIDLAHKLRRGGVPDVGLEHSRLATPKRVEVLDQFRQGHVRVLVSVKSLVEGIDVPEADVGVSVAATSSVRQRVQALGRVLRRQFDKSAPVKRAEMHLLYVMDTVDEVIYGKEDWADLTGEGSNHYWDWDLEGKPREAEGPPRSPRPTEEQEWERLGRRAPESPVPWYGVLSGQEYSVDTMGTVTNSAGAIMANPQHVAEIVRAVRGRPGGRFRVTPVHRLVVVWGENSGGAEPLVVSQLTEHFAVSGPSRERASDDFNIAGLSPGDQYPGPSTRDGGTFKLSQKRGGVIERRVEGGSEFALVEGTDQHQLEANAQRVLDAWRKVLDRGITFHLTAEGHAWYSEGGNRRFLAAVPGGFVWKSTNGGED